MMEEHSDIMELLIHNGVDVDQSDTETGLTPLHHAVAQARPKYVDRLLVAGCDLNARDNHGMTAIMLASQEGELEIVAMLVQEAKFPEDEARRGLEIVDVRDKSKWTPLHYAAHRGELEIAEYLLEEGDANQHMKDKNGFTASQVALQEGFGELTAYLDAKNAHLHSEYNSKA
jgi:ankyrin repeat protein